MVKFNSGGTSAEKHGKEARDLVAQAIQSQGYAVQTSKQLSSATVPGFAREVGGFTSLYGTAKRVDFLVRHAFRWPVGLAIDVVWQGSAGSVDEKLAHRVLSLKGLDIPAALFMAGGGYRAEALAWVQAQEDDNFFVVEDLDVINLWLQANL